MSTDVNSLSDSYVMNTYRRYPATFVNGSGMHLYDASGKEYLDFVAGIAVVSLGHSHPRVTEAVSSQITRLAHVSNLYYTEPMARLAEKLCGLLGWDDGKVFFCNSGAEANECAIKLVRKRSRLKFGQNRFETIAALDSFHGRTLETLAATGQPKKWEPFTPLRQLSKRRSDLFVDGGHSPDTSRTSWSGLFTRMPRILLAIVLRRP